MLGKRRFATLVTISALSLLAPLLAAPSLAGDASAYAYVTSSDDDHRAFLGVGLEEETEYSEGGARITNVIDDSAAEEAGLRKGDIVVGFEGQTIRGPVALKREIHDHEPGDAVDVTVVRDGREETFVVELGERPNLFSFAGKGRGGFKMFAPRVADVECDDGEDCSFSWSCSGDDCPSFPFGGFRRPMLGVQLVEVTAELREHLGGQEDAGVLISKVLEGMPAEAAGIEVGDLMVSVDGETVGSVGDIWKALAGKRGESLDVEVVRDRRLERLRVDIPEREEDAPRGPRAYFYLHGDPGEAGISAEEALRKALELSEESRESAAEALEKALELSRRSGSSS